LLICLLFQCYRLHCDLHSFPTRRSSDLKLFAQYLDIKDENSLLDLACGQGRHLIELAQKGNYNLFGLDRSRYLIQRAKNISRKRSEEHTSELQSREKLVSRLRLEKQKLC